VVDANGYGLGFEGSGSFELSNASNRIGTIASASSINGLQLTSALDLLIGSVGARSGLNAQSTLTLVSSGGISITQSIQLGGVGDISLHGLGTLAIAAGKSITAAAGNVTLVAGRITNQAGSSALTASGTNKVWQIWSTNADPFNTNPTIGDVTGGLVNNYKQYNATYGVTTVLGTGNGFLYTLAPTITVTLVGPISKPYDGTTIASLEASNYQVSGAILEDAVTINNPVTGVYTTVGSSGVGATAKDVGTSKTVAVTGLIVSSSSNGSIQVYGYAPTTSTISTTIGEITPATVTISASKPYDGMTTLSSSQVLLTGVTVGGVTETLTFTGAPVSSDANVATVGKYVSGIATLANATDGSGGIASNYLLPSQASASPNNTVAIDAVIATVIAEKVYDGSLELSSAQLRITGVTVGGVQQTLGFVGTAVVSDANVATADKYVRGIATLANATDSSGGLASNYILPTQLNSSVNNQAYVTRATLTLTGTRQYNGTTSFAGMYLSAVGVNSESFALTGFGDSSNLLSKNVQTTVTLNSVTGLSIGVTTGANAAVASNYNAISTIGSTVSVTKATAILAASKTYDGTALLTADQVTLTGVTVGGTTETLSFTGTPVLSDPNVAATKYVMGVTSVSDATDGSGGLASNYVLPNLTSASASNVASIIPAVAALSANKTYDGTNALSASQLTITGITLDGVAQVLGYTGTPVLAYTNVVSPNNYVDVAAMALSNGGTGASTGIASNYALSLSSYDASSNYASVTKAPITISAIKRYDGTYDMNGHVTIATGVTVLGVTETLAYRDAVASDSNVATAGKYLSALTILDATDGSGGRVSNYIVPVLSASSAPVTLTPAPLSATGSKVYDTLLTFPGSRLTVVGLNGDTFTATGSALMLTKNVQVASPVANTINLVLTPVGTTQAANYSGLAATDVSVTVTALPVTLVAPTLSKTYDGGYTYAMTTSDLSNLSAQLLSGDSVTRAEVIFAGNNPNVGINKTVDLVSATIADGNNGRNYSATLASSTNSTITRAPLMVTAVNDAKFVNQTDAQGYANNCGANTACQGNYLGVIYSGFVNGENAMTAVDILGTVVRSNPTQNSPGIYSGVLVPTGYGASNYVVAFANGDYTVLDAQELLVRVIPSLTIYGNSPVYDATNVKAQYLAADRTTIVDLVPEFASGRATISDGGTSTASLGFTPALPQYSSSGNLVVGGYNLFAVSPTVSGPNFSALKLVGQHDVGPKPIAAAEVGVVGVSKMYDGNNSVNDLPLTLSLESGRVLRGDVLTANGTGLFDTANIGSGKALNLTVSIAGTDAQNYVLSDTSLVSGVNSTAGGAITQRPVVGWRGSASGGLWSDPSNWADGAVPTGSNVGQVVITDGMNVIYDTASVGVITSAIENRGAISFNNSTDFTLTNSISGTGSLVLTGTGTITLSGDNSFTGGVNLNSASVMLGSATALGTGPLTSNGGTLSVTPGITLNALTVVGPVTLASDLLTSGAQSYTGAVTLSAGSAVGGVVTPMQIGSDNADIAFNGTLLGGSNSLANKQSVSIGAGTGVVSFTGQIGATRGTYGDFLTRVSDQSFYRLNVTASTISASGDIATFDSQTFNGTLQIGGSGSNGTARTFMSVDPTITINGRIDDTIANTHSLQLIAVSLTGAESQSIVLNGAVGSVRPLANLVLTTGIQDPTLTAPLGSVAANPATYSGTIQINESVTTGGNQTYTSNAVQLGSGGPGETITFQTTSGGRITFNLGLTGNGGGVTAAPGSTGLSAAFTPSTDYVNSAFLAALTAAGIPYTVGSVGTGDSGSGGASGSSGIGSVIVNIAATQATSASVVGWLNQLVLGSVASKVRIPAERSPDIGTIFGMHEANDAGQSTQQSSLLTVAQQPNQSVPPCEEVSISGLITVCVAE
jgi:autotransporter-associated beta strand protein